MKTEGSAKEPNLAPEMLERLRARKLDTEFGNQEDWVFASPIRLGRPPYSCTGVCVAIQEAATAARIGRIGTHTVRQSLRSWMDAMGTSVQQKLMRHADIRTTKNIYGDVVTDEMTTAVVRVAQLAFSANGAQAERNGS